MRAIANRIGIPFAALFLALACALSSAPALAWSHGSHMTTGAIAYDDLARSDPAVIAELDRIVAAHPHYDRLIERVDGVTGPERMRVMLQWLARWPDDIRDDPEFDCYECHYELRVVHGLTWLWPFRNGLATSSFAEHFATLSDQNAPLRERAIAVAWLAHITGDVQQPLHAGHQLTWDFIGTDRAGLESYVRREDGGEALSLHWMWDAALDVEGEPTATVDALARPLQQAFLRDALPGLDYDAPITRQVSIWLDESMLLAKRFAYQGTALKATAEEGDAPVMAARENGIMVELSKRRVVMGGYRLADVFRAALR